MKRYALGESSLEISAIGLGTWAMGGTVDEWGLVDDRESIAVIHQALDSGITLIDTAPSYGLGHAEEIVGRAILTRRDEVILATKCGLLFPKSRGDKPIRCLAPQSILRECDDSLRRLRTEVIDLYQCHWPDPSTPIRDTMEAMSRLLDQGKIRAIGLANFGCERLAAAREFGPVHSLQVPFSVLNRRASNDLLPDCVEHNTAVLACSPLAKGLLTGRLKPDHRFEGVRAHDPELTAPRFARHLEVVERLRTIAAQYGKTVGQLAINWVSSQTGVTAPIFGAKRPSQVLENAGGVGWSLNEEDRTLIDGLIRGVER